MSAVELAREGLNRSCVDCSDVPLFGGMRCYPCFYRKVVERRGEHEADGPPGYATYVAGCRCRDCKAASAAYTRKRRNAR